MPRKERSREPNHRDVRRVRRPGRILRDVDEYAPTDAALPRVRGGAYRGARADNPHEAQGSGRVRSLARREGALVTRLALPALLAMTALGLGCEGVR